MSKVSYIDDLRVADLETTTLITIRGNLNFHVNRFFATYFVSCGFRTETVARILRYLAFLGEIEMELGRRERLGVHD